MRRLVGRQALDDIHVIGHSRGGGQIALRLAIALPDRARGVVLTGSAGLGEQSLVGSLVSLRLSSPRRADYEGVRRVIATAFRNPVHATKDLVDEVYRVFNDEPSHATNVLSLVRSVTRAPLADVLPHVRQPVCLIWGRQDVITPPAIARDFQRRLANADLFWIDECGHAPMIEQPDAFNRVLENWLAAQRSG